MCGLTIPAILNSLLRFIDIEEQSVFLSLCKTTRKWILHPSREKSHMLECLLLTDGCWKQVQTKRYELCEPAKCVEWARRLPGFTIFPMATPWTSAVLMIVSMTFSQPSPTSPPSTLIYNVSLA
eukprot:Blabericola_migrator_1__5960@NODE_3002_length_2122_cov_113_983942_g1877_i0_p2_GENE_NODE_3002_length_2122_cov_113_983942_g1877_i0NODE_3002_length_2122_cov_113_983942_g1877_i0_p2_ORF_typecomplete_len124_score17_20_NODE_3002_length_2122_cov_113_983942_g1877_i0506877